MKVEETPSIYIVYHYDHAVDSTIRENPQLSIGSLADICLARHHRGLVGLIFAYIAWNVGGHVSTAGSCLIWEQHKLLSSTSKWLFIRSDLFPCHSILLVSPAHTCCIYMYIASFSLQVYAARSMGVVLALGYEDRRLFRPIYWTPSPGVE